MNDYRNPVIAEAMKVMDYVNMFSRGVGRVQEVLRENGNAEAVFELDKITVFNVVVRENPEEAAMALMIHPKESPSLKSPPKTREKTREKILALIRIKPESTTEDIANRLGITVKGIDWQIANLKKKGLLRRVGPDKGGHWEVLK